MAPAVHCLSAHLGAFLFSKDQGHRFDYASIFAYRPTDPRGLYSSGILPLLFQQKAGEAEIFTHSTTVAAHHIHDGRGHISAHRFKLPPVLALEKRRNL